MGDAASQECCCPGVLGMLQTEPISADFKGKSVPRPRVSLQPASHLKAPGNNSIPRKT